MTASGWVIVLSGGAGLAALVLAASDASRPARVLSRVALWSALAIVPVSLVSEVTEALATSAQGPQEGALGEAVMTGLRSGVVALMCAGIAMMALRRAGAVRARRR